MSSSETTGMQTLVVGLDGACLPVLEPLIEEGVVPHIASLHKASAVAPLESQLPPWTPSAWPSLYTGKNPGKHGVYDFLRFDGYDWDIVNRSTVKAQAVWELLSANGYESVVVNVPVTHPPRAFDGTLVPGYMAPESPDCHPKGTWAELNDELGGYQLYADHRYSESSKQQRLESYKSLTRMRGEAFRYLVADRKPDFGFVQFQQTDTVFHEYPDDDAVVRGVYRTVDEELGAILESCDPDITLIVSDHGMGRMDGREFRVNEFLRDKEFLTATAGSGGMPSWSSLAKSELQNDQQADHTEPSTAKRAIELAATVGITSQRIESVLTQLGLKKQIVDLVPTDMIRAGTERVDFESSTAYMRSRTEMGIRLNLDQREPAGVVSQADYESVRSELIEALSAVTTPGGHQVFEAVLPREDVFEGPYLDAAPDIVTVPSAFSHYLSASLRGEWFGDPSEPWEHKRQGVVMASGEEIDSQTDVDGHLFDITPTVLSTFGLAVGEEMDGSPLPIVSSTSRTSYPNFEPTETTPTDDPAVEQRLADLGYLE